MSGRSSVPVEVQSAILAWYEANGRPLAFRQTTDPYAVLVSEAMAQQTQASRAAGHWIRFMARFPTITDLAAASPADVQRAWQGLGYNRRAMALWRAAGLIQREHGGRVPGSIEELERLPGVGPYTARAVVAIAFGRPVGAVDVNTRRVLGRMLVGGKDAIPPKRLQAIADDIVPSTRTADWTHALMDIGATLCRPVAPRCDACPARAWCQYARGGATDGVHRAQAPHRRRTARFSSTNRWLRGRILDRLRAAAGDAWVVFDAPIGVHDLAKVRGAIRALAAEGLIEVDGESGELPRARLATA